MSKPEVKKRVESETRGKVHILRLIKKQGYMPQRKASVKRTLRKLKTFFPCRATEITAEDLIDLILKTFGEDHQYHILVSDERFRTITKEQMEQLLKEDDTDTLPYISPEYFDCDDFADVLLGSLTRKTLNQGFALGQIWWYHKTQNYGHAQNIFCDGESLWICEPQNDSIMMPQDYMRAFMVKF